VLLELLEVWKREQSPERRGDAKGGRRKKRKGNGQVSSRSRDGRGDDLNVPEKAIVEEMKKEGRKGRSGCREQGAKSPRPEQPRNQIETRKDR
jgi:hypothetical protein